MHRQSLIQYVNTLQGSDSRREFSTGNTYPAVGVPRGMTYWTPQTSDGRFLFDRSESELCGIRATHSPSPWMGDFGHFDIFPVVGTIGNQPHLRASRYDIDKADFAPQRARIHLLDCDVDLRFAASSRCAVFEMDFRSLQNAAIVLQTGAAESKSYGEIEVRALDRACEILGASYSSHGGCPDGYGCFFVAEISAVVQECGVIDTNLTATQGRQHSGPRAGAYLRLDGAQKVVVRVATSFISLEQARFNLQEEVGTRGLDHVAASAHESWSQWLSKVEAEGGTQSAHECLTTAMYRVGLFPMCGHEPDGRGGYHHRSPYDGRIHSGQLYTNNGFWDTHRTLYPLLALIDPLGFGEIVDGFLQAFRHTGWLPKWASPGFRDCMLSTHVDAVISEAIMRDIRGFDYQEAYQAIRRNAFDVSDEPTTYGRVGLEEYNRIGFVPADVAACSVSRTLDFAHCDWCIAQVARKLGHDQDADYLAKRSFNYRNLWFAPEKLMRPKLSNGNWQEPWNPLAWGHAYIEGGAWQFSFNVPHDPEGLAKLCGGTDSLIVALEEMLSMGTEFDAGSYQDTIHEMTEMAHAKDCDGNSFGQYAHSNQPVHGFLWYPAALGRRDWTAHQVDRVMRGLYRPDALPGDEDNGEMSAWYILAAMGRFPLCPGSGQMVSAPSSLFESVSWGAAEAIHRRVDVGSRVLQPNAIADEPKPKASSDSPG